jgi:hypothetical protein
MNDPRVRSYLTLRKAIGIVGFALPIVIMIGKMILQGPGIQHSVSGYYYTVMRDVLVGSLCAIGVFLWSYRGYDDPDPRLQFATDNRAIRQRDPGDERDREVWRKYSRDIAAIADMS